MIEEPNAAHRAPNGSTTTAKRSRIRRSAGARSTICGLLFLFACVVAVEAAPLDGTYVGTGDSSGVNCWINSTKVVVSGNRVTWKASHDGTGTLDSGGNVTISSLSGKGSPVTITGAISGDAFEGTEVEQRANGCTWHLHLVRAGTATNACSPGCKRWSRQTGIGGEPVCTELVFCPKNRRFRLTDMHRAPVVPPPR